MNEGIDRGGEGDGGEESEWNESSENGGEWREKNQRNIVVPSCTCKISHASFSHFTTSSVYVCVCVCA